ncbi:hypothetical protein PSPO_a2257 [Pseudoalteromonas spongiae UST010723-006]|nr:hypothetical protein PSPO_a2257 [Pseudoalteromonas spongiae UST010723-006]
MFSGALGFCFYRDWEVSKLLKLFVLLLLTGCGSDVVEQQPQVQDPIAEEVPLAFVIRDSSEAVSFSLADPTLFNPGAALYFKKLAGVDAPLVNISSTLFEQPIDIKHVSASADGNKLVFSLRAPELEDASDDMQPKWNIWLYDVVSDKATKLISDELIAEEGDDLFPVFLPDGRILFSSNRQQGNKARLLDEGKPQYQALSDNFREKALTLHVMEQDGSDIKQISYSQGHDLYPQVLQNGKIAFVRYEHRGRNRGLHIYQIDSDGKQLELVFGAHSDYPNDLAIASLQQAPNGKLVIGLRDGDSELPSTDFYYLDSEQFMDNGRFHDGNETQQSAFSSSLFALSPPEGELALTGKYHWFTPIFDESQRSLVVWSQCQVIDPNNTDNVIPCTEALLNDENTQAAPDLFGLWIYDETTKTQKPVVLAEQNKLIEEVVVLESKNAPLETEYSSDLSLQNEQMGSIHIRSVYDFSGEDTANPNITTISDPSVNAERVYAVRVIKPVSIPDRNEYNFSTALFGRSSGQSMRDILGYAPVAPDGSVHVKVPADVPFSLELLNRDGQRISGRHESWLQLKAGETRTCNGCHQSTNELPHGKVAQQNSVNLGAASTSWVGSFGDINAQIGETMAQSFARVVGLPTLSPEPIFPDVWREGIAAEADLTGSLVSLETASPLTDACAQNWTNLCRLSIHFPEHIAPLFALSRPQLDANGDEVANFRCLNCHITSDENGDAQIPAAQLDLSLSPSNENNQHAIAYRELFFNDNEQELVDGILIDKLVDRLDENGNPVYLVDEDGNLILDEDGNPIIEQVTVTIRPALSVAGAAANTRFNTLFATAGSHANYLSEAEKSLLWQWLDIGAQYANSPFYSEEE